MVNRKLVTKVACIGLVVLFLAQIGLLGRWGLSRADIQADGITFEPATPVLDEFFTVWGYSSSGLANVEMGIDHWEYAVRIGDVPWDSSGHEDAPEQFLMDPFQWGWYVKITQPGDYVFTFYKDCDTACTVVAQETITFPDPDGSLTFEPTTPDVDEFFIAWGGHLSAGLTYVEMGIDHWEFAERRGGIPWDSSGREDGPDYADLLPPYRWGWDVRITQPGDYVFTFYKDCNTGCIVVAQETITIPDPTVDVYLPLVLSESVPGVIPIEEAPDTCPGTPIQVGRQYREDFDHSNDNDWYEIQVVGGQAYTMRTFDLESRADTVMYLYASDCSTLLAENDDVAGGNPASQIVWTAPSSGVYYIDVRSYNYTIFGSDTGYSLEVVEGVPDAVDVTGVVDKAPPLPTPMPGGSR